MNISAAIVFVIYAAAVLSLRYFNTGSAKTGYIIRKSVHLATGIVIFFLTYYFEKQTVLMLISAGTVLSVLTCRLKSFRFIHNTPESSLGTVFYPIGLLFSFILLFNMPVYYFRISLMILSVSDTIANICGEIKRINIRFTVLNETKSLFGAAGFALSAFLIHVILLPDHGRSDGMYILLSVIAALNFELISSRGSDNFTIPAGCSLFFLLTRGACANPVFPAIAIPLLASGMVIFYRKGVLTRYGSIAAYLLGIYLVLLPGAAWIVPVLAFFLTSVAFTKINGSVNGKTEDTGRRNIWQVLANIFFAAASSACYLFTGNRIFIFFYIVLIAAVTADTWASELGPVFSKRCFSLRDFSLKESGISGGVSPAGTAVSLLGALFISALSYYLFFQKTDTRMTVAIAFAGFAGGFADSLLSAFLEPVLMKMKFFNKDAGPDYPAPNDIVNLLGSLSAPFFYILIMLTLNAL